MPEPPSIAAMSSWSIVTPVYSEAVLYSARELLAPLSDGRTLLDTLRALYAREWAHFLERVGVHCASAAASYHIHWHDAQLALQVRLWASMRGQTLTRTMVGMLEYERALALLSRAARCEARTSVAEAAATIGAKFSLVIAAQLYAQFKARADLEAKVTELEAKLAATEVAPPKKARKPKAPKEPKEPKESKPKKGLDPEELAERRRQNGLRLAAANKARREAEHQAWLAQQLEQKKTSESGNSTESCESESETEQ
jgi:hypothetical protein